MSSQQCLVTPPLEPVDGSRVSGDAFDLQLRPFVRGESVMGGISDLGEEVGAIVEGSFDVFAADECYSLTAGEAIVIPPHEPRRWVCTSAKGLLYRAIVRIGAVPERAQ
jgi:quercetin dioxygenase-like cupin family protein